MARLTQTMVCDRCGTARDYQGTKATANLFCRRCQRRGWHVALGAKTWSDDTAAREREANAKDLALVLRYRQTFQQLGFTLKESTEDMPHAAVLSWDDMTVWEHPRLAMGKKVEAFRILLRCYVEELEFKAGCLYCVPAPSNQGAALRQEQVEAWLIPADQFEKIPD